MGKSLFESAFSVFSCSHKHRLRFDGHGPTVEIILSYKQMIINTYYHLLKQNIVSIVKVLVLCNVYRWT